MVNVHKSEVEDEVEALRLKDLLLDCLNKLSQCKHWKAKRYELIFQHRILAKVFHAEKMTLKQIGDRVGVSGNAVRMDEERLLLRLHRWLKRVEATGCRMGFLNTIGLIHKDTEVEKVMKKLALLPPDIFATPNFIVGGASVSFPASLINSLNRRGMLVRKTIKEVDSKKVFGKRSAAVYVYQISEEGRKRVAVCA